MCGRFSNNIPIEDLIAYFGLSRGFPLEERYNLAPSQDVAMIRQQGAERSITLARWGLVPHWAREVQIGYKMINARAETVESRPSFRDAFRRQRCIIPASGFYEWKKAGKDRQPYYIFRKDGAPLALAGLWDRWENPEHPGEVVVSCTIITTEANGLVAQLHNRMPALLEPATFDAWFDPHQGEKDLHGLLRPAAEGVLDLYPVSGYVNKPGNEGAECIKPEGE